MATTKNKERVGKWIDKWKPRLLLDHWAIIVTYLDEPCSGDINRLAEVIVNKMYNEGRIRIYPKFFRESAALQQATIRHELMHVVTDPVKEILDLACTKGVISDKRRETVLETLTEHFSKIMHQRDKRTAGYHL